MVGMASNEADGVHAMSEGSVPGTGAVTGVNGERISAFRCWDAAGMSVPMGPVHWYLGAFDVPRPGADTGEEYGESGVAGMGGIAAVAGPFSPKAGTGSLNDEDGPGTSGHAGGTSGQEFDRCGSLRSEGTLPPEFMPGLGVPGMFSCPVGGAAAKLENAPRNCSPEGSVGGSCMGRSGNGSATAKTVD
ncbi:hypothetical protein GCM10023193_47510 [Planotetraspora kaengkrachanensis]|uniref:Uncharacterized protein n=1 Tax=Planotetraspora kaengkrachanensis TaxID=575193 RepID=A0A8J3LX20_9ACTN|nr:hypothetical protein Pka01_38200 [Planotetraspora kaengkrachanensis]